MRASNSQFDEVGFSELIRAVEDLFLRQLGGSNDLNKSGDAYNQTTEQNDIDAGAIGTGAIGTGARGDIPTHDGSAPSIIRRPGDAAKGTLFGYRDPVSGVPAWTQSPILGDFDNAGPGLMLDGSTGRIYMRRSSITFDVPSVLTITATVTAPSAAGVKGQLHCIY